MFLFKLFSFLIVAFMTWLPKPKTIIADHNMFKKFQQKSLKINLDLTIIWPNKSFQIDIISSGQIGPQVPSGLILETFEDLCYCFHFARSLSSLLDLVGNVNVNRKKIFSGAVYFNHGWMDYYKNERNTE